MLVHSDNEREPTKTRVNLSHMELYRKMSAERLNSMYSVEVAMSCARRQRNTERPREHVVTAEYCIIWGINTVLFTVFVYLIVFDSTNTTQATARVCEFRAF